MTRKKTSSRTILFSEWQRLSFVNSPKLPQSVNVNGHRWEWVGIGWIDCGSLKGDEVLVVDDKEEKS